MQSHISYAAAYIRYHSLFIRAEGLMPVSHFFVYDTSVKGLASGICL